METVIKSREDGIFFQEESRLEIVDRATNAGLLLPAERRLVLQGLQVAGQVAARENKIATQGHFRVEEDTPEGGPPTLEENEQKLDVSKYLIFFLANEQQRMIQGLLYDPQFEE